MSKYMARPFFLQLVRVFITGWMTAWMIASMSVGHASENGVSELDKCTNLTGIYALYGEALPGKPTTFRGANYALDEMLGLDLSFKEKEKIVGVELDQQAHDRIRIRFLTSTGMLKEKLLAPSVGIINTILCDQDKVIIHEIGEGKGEAVSGEVEITDRLSLDNEGSLLVDIVIQGTSRTLIFSWASREETYGARFKRIQQQ